MDSLDVLRRPFHERVPAAAPWAWLAFGGPRWGVTLLLASLPALLALLGVALLPQAFREALVDPARVHDTFARFVGAVATAAAIAVSVATLTLGRQLRGLDAFEEHLHEDEAFRARMRRGRGGLPLSLGGFLAALYGDIARAAEDARRHASPRELELRADGAVLGEFLATLGRQAERTATATGRKRHSPDRMLLAALDFEEEMAAHLARRFRRLDALSPSTRERLDTLNDRLDESTVARSYAKTLDTQYGLSRMASTLLLTSFVAVFVSAGMVLTYGHGVIDAWGEVGASLLVAAALFAVALPLASFVSYVLRFVFLNAHTLPTRGFILGQEMQAEDEPGRPGRVVPDDDREGGGAGRGNKAGRA